MRAYTGPPIRSADRSNMQVLGIVNIQRCVVSKDCTIQDLKFPVLSSSMHDCIIGRNTIEMIPSLHASLTNIRSDILMFAKEIDELEHDLIRDFRVNQTDNQQSTAEEGAIIIFPGFRDSRPPIAMSKEACPPQNAQKRWPRSRLAHLSSKNSNQSLPTQPKTSTCLRISISNFGSI